MILLKWGFTYPLITCVWIQSLNDIYLDSQLLNDMYQESQSLNDIYLDSQLLSDIYLDLLLDSRLG